MQFALFVKSCESCRGTSFGPVPRAPRRRCAKGCIKSLSSSRRNYSSARMGDNSTGSRIGSRSPFWAGVDLRRIDAVWELEVSGLVHGDPLVDANLEILRQIPRQPWVGATSDHLIRKGAQRPKIDCEAVPLPRDLPHERAFHAMRIQRSTCLDTRLGGHAADLLRRKVVGVATEVGWGGVSLARITQVEELHIALTIQYNGCSVQKRTGMSVEGGQNQS